MSGGSSALRESRSGGSDRPRRRPRPPFPPASIKKGLGAAVCPAGTGM